MTGHKAHGLWTLVYGYKKMGYDFYKDRNGNFKQIAGFLNFTHKQIAEKCINRYFKMFVKNKTVGTYNKVVERVCNRIYSNWHSGGEHLKIYSRRDEYRVAWNDTFECYGLKRDLWRYKSESGKVRLKMWKPRKQNKVIAKKLYWKNQWKLDSDYILNHAWQENFSIYRLERLREVEKEKIELKEIRRLIKKLKGSIKENE